MRCCRWPPDRAGTEEDDGRKRLLDLKIEQTRHEKPADRVQFVIIQLAGLELYRQL